MSYLELMGPSLAQHIPELLAWLVGFILAVRMLRRGGSKAEKLFLAGCSLLVALHLASPFLSGLVSSLLREGWRSRQAVSLMLTLPVSILGLAGLVCLVYAFWLKFWTRKRGQSNGI